MSDAATIRPLTDREFAGFQRLVYSEAGIYLGEAKKALLTTRLTPRLRELRLKNFGEYFGCVRRSPDERQRMLDAVCTNETHFFREPAQFRFVAERIVPQWREEAAAGIRRREANVWSAACSTGEEPYSIAMTLLEALPDWRVNIVATDLSTKVLAKARAGIWPLSRASEIEERLLHAYMRRGVGRSEGLMRASDELRRAIRFEQLNLNDASYPLGSFDLIFCRNVLIYFDAASKQRVIARLTSHLADGGYLFLGHAESLHGAAGLKPVVPNVYRLVPAAP